METTVAEFSIRYRRFIGPDGQPVDEAPNFAKDIALLKELYRKMVLVRLFDKKAIALQRTGKLGTYPSILGHEAHGIGIGYAMAKDDVFAPYYRDHATLIERGVTMSEIYTYWGGDERGSDYAVPREDFPPCIPIATQLLHATGIASAFKMRGQARAAVTTCGDGATSKGDFYEAINVAGVWKLPVVFVACNNRWAISVPLAKQTATQTIAQKAIAAGFPGIQVDGNDIIAVIDSMQTALARAKQGHGATLLETMTYRLSDHTTADDAKRYRSQTEVDDAWDHEPILRLRRYLQFLDAWEDAFDDKTHADCSEQIEASVDAYLNNTPEPVSAMFDYLYAELPDEILAQREAVISEAQS